MSELRVELPLRDAIREALRCTTHIHEADIRAKYIAADLMLRGFVIQETHRDRQGRFAAKNAGLVA